MKRAWIFLVVAAGASVGMGFSYTHVGAELFFRGYLFGFMFVLGLSLGSLTLLMLHNLTGGAWGDAIRPALRAASAALPVLAVLFIPIALNLAALYPWARTDAGANELIAHRMPYLNAPFFWGRAAVYFVIWIVLMVIMVKPGRAGKGISAAGLILYLLTMTQAGVDWVQSRDTEFYSTAYGFVVTLGQTLSAMALAILVTARGPDVRVERGKEGEKPTLFNDMGNVLLTLVILWMYVSFMQFLVIWMGNSGEDNGYFVKRGVGDAGPESAAIAWRIIGGLLIVFHFFVPFFILLFRSAKGYAKSLVAVAVVLLLAHVLEQYWLVAPADHKQAVFDPTIADGLGLVGFLAWWGFAVCVIRPRLGAERVVIHAEGVAHA